MLFLSQNVFASRAMTNVALRTLRNLKRHLKQKLAEKIKAWPLLAIATSAHRLESSSFSQDNNEYFIEESTSGFCSTETWNYSDLFLLIQRSNAAPMQLASEQKSSPFFLLKLIKKLFFAQTFIIKVKFHNPSATWKSWIRTKSFPSVAGAGC